MTDTVPRRSPLHALGVLVPGYGERLGLPLWLLFGARIINALAFTSAFPFLASYLREERSVAGILVGVLYTTQGVVGALFQGLGGMLAERMGQKPVLVWSLAARALLTFAMGALLKSHAPVLIVCALVVLNAVLAGLFQPAADSLVAEFTTDENRVAAFAHQRVAINIGWAIAPALGGWVSDRFSLAESFLAAAPVVLIGVFVLTRLPSATRAPSPSRPVLKMLGETLRIPGIRAHFLGALFTFTLSGQLIVTLSLDATSRLHLDHHEVGLIWALNGLLVVFAQMPVARVVSRLGTRTALVCSSLIYGASYAAVGFVHSFEGLVGCMVFISLGELLNTPAQQTIVASRAPSDGLGRAMGMLGLVMMLGRSLGPLAGGAAHDAWADSPRMMWGVLGALGVVGALAYLHPSLGEKRRVAAEPTRS